MKDNSADGMHAVANRRRGLFMAIAALLVLIALAAYRVPIFNKELPGVIVGVAAMHDESGKKSMAIVELETGSQVRVAMPSGLLLNQATDVKVNEGRTLLGRKSYRIIADSE